MSGTGQVVLPKVRVWPGDSLKGPAQVGGHFQSPGRIGGPTWRSGTDRGTLPEVRDESRDPTKGLGRVGGPSQRSRMGRVLLPEVWDGSEDPTGGPGLVEGPSERSGTGRETLPVVRDWSGTLPKVQLGSGDNTGDPG